MTTTLLQFFLLQDVENDKENQLPDLESDCQTCTDDKLKLKPVKSRGSSPHNVKVSVIFPPNTCIINLLKLLGVNCVFFFLEYLQLEFCSNSCEGCMCT